MINLYQRYKFTRSIIQLQKTLNRFLRTRPPKIVGTSKSKPRDLDSDMELLSVEENQARIPMRKLDSMNSYIVTEDPATSSSSPTWAWVQPSKFVITRDDSDVIPIIEGVLLTPEEIFDGLSRLGCIDLKKVELHGKMGGELLSFIIGTGTSTRHLKKMSDMLVKTLSLRKLKRAPGSTGAEGVKDDDWIIVDCWNHAVHLMLYDTRRALDLEGHWSQESRPTARFSALEKLRKFDEDELDRLVDEFPIPSYYNPNSTQHIGMSDQTRSKSRNRFASNSSPSIQSSTNSVSRFPSQKSSLSYDKSRVKRPSNKR